MQSPRLASSGWAQALGPLLTVVAVFAAEVFYTFDPELNERVFPGSILAPLLATVLIGIFVGGHWSGWVSAAIVILYEFYYLAPHGTLMVATASTARVASITVGVIVITLVASLLRQRQDQARARERARIQALEQANADLETFAYVVSHDLKEPVRGLQALLEDAEAGNRDALPLAKRTADRLAALCDGLIRYSRVSLAPSDLMPVDPAVVLRSDACAAMYETLARERGAEVRVELMPLVLANDQLLCQALGNLVLNAVRHNSGTAPAVRVHASRDGDDVVIHVEDNGPGFPPELLARRLRGDRPSTVRGGFGLSLVQRALTRMGGSLELAHRPGGGGLARVRLRAP
ncbi:MAG TPA: HAMP domain-containing sensor histidine kinase [Candidatus Thermoplasmatota archaeon]|nr:HAMP domain-containing sensor histidine kinase [Candidatus Thermoplasmatota archaeon]